jgi:UDP:flavonoid glycosyltransferase YjiC (YdhE family)
MRILEVADCAVIHGGMTSVYECIYHQVPMVVYPFDVNDQLGTAARVDYHRIGVVGDRSVDDQALIRQHVQTALGDPAIRSNLERFERCIEACSTGKRLEQAVDSLLHDRAPPAAAIAH